MIKTYEWKGGLWRFDTDDVPDGAVEHKMAPKVKTRRTRNKSRTVKNKEARNG